MKLDEVRHKASAATATAKALAATHATTTATSVASLQDLSFADIKQGASTRASTIKQGAKTKAKEAMEKAKLAKSQGHEMMNKNMTQEAWGEMGEKMGE